MYKSNSENKRSGSKQLDKFISKRAFSIFAAVAMITGISFAPLGAIGTAAFGMMGFGNVASGNASSGNASFSTAAFGVNKADAYAQTIDIWWPVSTQPMSGTQPFKAMLENVSVDQYNMFWQVDSGQLNYMPSNYNGYPHKETSVDFSGWTWKGSGPYNINFVAEDFNSNVLSEKSVAITVANGLPEYGTVSAAPSPAPAPSVNITWPQNNTTVSGSEQLQAQVAGMPLNNYQMYWQVDTSQLNSMADGQTASGQQVKIANIDFSGWTWKGSGPYTITFVAKDLSGNEIAQASVQIMVGGSATATATPQATSTTTPSSTSTTTPSSTTTSTSSSPSNTSSSTTTTTSSSTPTSTPTTTSSTTSNTTTPISSSTSNSTTATSQNLFSGQKLWVDPNSDAANWIRNNNSAGSYDISLMQKIADGSTAAWFSKDWISNIYDAVNNYVTNAADAGAMPVMVLYDIPYRDCGQYSAGGTDSTNYESEVNDFANAIGARRAAVIVEPDALALTSCLSADQLAQRFQLISYAVSRFKQNPNTAVYLDIGHPDWLTPQQAAANLARADVAGADGFSLNVSNFYTDQQNIDYAGQIVSALQSQYGISGKRAVIDRSRNGNGSNGQWCNPSGMALGYLPTTDTGNPLVDAFLWVKEPGSSDGTCNGGPSAGTFWPDYALGLAQNAKW